VFVGQKKSREQALGLKSIATGVVLLAIGRALWSRV